MVTVTRAAALSRDRARRFSGRDITCQSSRRHQRDHGGSKGEWVARLQTKKKGLQIIERSQSNGHANREACGDKNQYLAQNRPLDIISAAFRACWRDSRFCDQLNNLFLFKLLWAFRCLQSDVGHRPSGGVSFRISTLSSPRAAQGSLGLPKTPDSGSWMARDSGEESSNAMASEHSDALVF